MSALIILLLSEGKKHQKAFYYPKVVKMKLLRVEASFSIFLLLRRQRSVKSNQIELQKVYEFICDLL